VQPAEVGDLLEGEARILDQPYGGRFWHERMQVPNRSWRSCDGAAKPRVRF
jgi:hypothetical protein